MKPMHYYEVAPTKLVRADSASFTYSSNDKLAIGQLVMVEIGKRELVGLVLDEVKKPNYATKAISRSLDDTPLPTELIELAQWLAGYYSTHLAPVLQSLLPSGLTKKRREIIALPIETARKRTTIVFTTEQTEAISTISAMSPGSALLHGVTGSGKTAVYIELARTILATGKSVIILVPEIALTSQLVDEFAGHFDDIILTHSKQTEAQRHQAWKTALDSNTPRVVIGPRSALFMPLKNIGLIVIDEAHEPSFKQEQSPRYSALRAASILAQAHHAKLILGSATPSASDYYLAASSGRPIVTMKKPAQKASKPTLSLVDMTKRTNFKRHRFLSDKLLVQLEDDFNHDKQTLIFHNRRGSASTTLCENCGWQAGCPRCFLPLTLHGDAHHLRCHICGFTDKVPTSCPSCHSVDIIHKGIGTKLIEQELRKLFPDKKIARFDGDNLVGETVEKNYKQLYDGDIDIIVGTQVVAKGLDLPNLRTVGVVQADAGLSLPDFGSGERTFQLLAQVVGRVGRSHHATNIIIQSYQPAHPAVTTGIAQNYADFYERTLKERSRANFPPFVFLLKLICIYKTETAAIRAAKKLADDLRTSNLKIEILGPTPAFYERQRDTYRWQIVIKAKQRQQLLDALAFVPVTHWQYELDPVSLLS